MGSNKPSKPRLRFNFLRPDQKRGSAASTRDDILNSMTKHAQAHGAPIEEETQPMLEVAETTGMEAQGPMPDDNALIRRHRHAGRLAFLLFLGGFLTIWGYGYMTRAYDIPVLSLITQNQAVQNGVQAASAHLLLVGLASGGLLLAVLFILARRKPNKF